VDYASLTPADLVVTNLDGKIVEGNLRPSSDLDTHTYLYREFPRSAASSTPTPSSQPPGPRLDALSLPRHNPRRLLPRPRSRHRALTAEEVAEAYVRNTAAVIVRRFRAENLDPLAVPGVLVAGHAPFVWGKTVAEAVQHADVLEYIARLAFRTILLRSAFDLSGASDFAIPACVSEHHYQRKHGPKATYGQL